MSKPPNPALVPRDQLRRLLLEQAAATFDRIFPATDAEQVETAEQREQRIREFGQQLMAVLLQQNNRSREGFLQDIFAHPSDDTPRLIYADFLDDNHQHARAEFIRLQCRLARLDPGDPDYELLEMQEQELLKEHTKDWMGHLPLWARKVLKFERGFVNHLTAWTRDFVRVKKLRQQVYFDSLHLLIFTHHHTEAFLNAGLLEGIRSLTLGGNAESLTLLLRSEQLASLESLTFDGCNFSSEVCGALLANRRLDRLRRLAFARTDLGIDQARILSQSMLLHQIQQFEVCDMTQPPESLRLLVHSPHWRQLKQLSLARCWPGPEAIRELLPSRMLQALTALDLSLSNLGEAVLDLARAPTLGNLTHLNLHGAEINDAGVEALANASGLPRLTSLSLYCNPLTAEGFRAFARGPLLSRLHRLVVGSWGLGPDAVRELIASSHCEQMRSLYLGNCELRPEDAAKLAASPHLSRLTSLSLCSNRIGASGAQALGASTNFPSLRYLDVSSNRLGPAGARALAESPLAQQLQGLNLKDNDLRVAFRQELRARLGQRLFA